MALKKKTSKANPELQPEEMAPAPDAEAQPEPDTLKESRREEAEAEAAPEEPAPKSVGQPGTFAKPSSEPLVADGERRVVLVNLQNRSIDVTLEHAVYCQAVGRCVCGSRDVFRRVRKERKSREEIVRRVPMLVAKSITIAPRGTSEPLHEAVRKCADAIAKTRANPPKIQIKPV